MLNRWGVTHLTPACLVAWYPFLRQPDHCTQKQLFDDYEVYVEQYREHHAKLFFANHNSKAFMRELYHPNLVRRQYSLRKDRAKSTAQLFMQVAARFETGCFMPATCQLLVY